MLDLNLNSVNMRSRFVLFSIFLIGHSAIAQQAPGGLTITVINGDGGQNSIKTRSGVPVELEVRDSAGKAVSGAQVIFQLPSFGPSGSFPGGQLTARTATGPAGQATMTGFVPNNVEGRFGIKITADSGTQSGAVVVNQVNVAMLASDKPKSHAALWALIAVGAGGAVAAGVLAGGKSSSSSTPVVTPTVTVNTGTITVGGPR